MFYKRSKNGPTQFYLPCLATKTILENVPDLSDIRFMGEILTQLCRSYQTRQIPGKCPANIQPNPPYELVRKIRASICLLVLSRPYKKSSLGSCVTSTIDLHLLALKEMGADIS